MAAGIHHGPRHLADPARHDAAALPASVSVPASGSASTTEVVYHWGTTGFVRA